MTNRGGLFGAVLLGAGGSVCTSLTLLCELFKVPLTLPLLTPGCTGAFNDEAELLWDKSSNYNRLK